MDPHGPHQRASVAAQHSHAGLFESEALIASLEVEGELTSGLTEEAITVCAELFAAKEKPVKRIIDLGCGPGVGTLQLAQAFPVATVVGVDGSQAMLDRARARVLNEARISWERLDLNYDLSSLGRCDLVWAAMVVHHAEDPGAMFARIGAQLERGGLVCILERADPDRITLGDDLGRPGIWDRLFAARRSRLERAGDGLPGEAEAAPYPGMLAQAGLELIEQRFLVTTARAPAGAAGEEFVARHLAGMERKLLGLVETADAEALRGLLKGAPPFPPRQWDGAEVTLSRRLLIARAGPPNSSG